MSPLDRLRERLGSRLREILKFLMVGGLGYVTDVLVFNLLRFAGGEGPLYDKPVTAKILSAVLATVVTYAGNRSWTFRHRERSGYVREYALFVVLNVIGVGIAVGCLAISHYVLDLRGPLADNISANVVGLGLGTTFRFWSYRRFVFREVKAALPTEVAVVPSGAGERG